MSPPVTCADRLRDLHARLTEGTWTLDPESHEFYADSGIGFGEGPILMVDDDDCLAIAAVRNALPEIAAVIEAAALRRDLDTEPDCKSREQLQDWCVRSYAADRRLDDSLAALSARLDGAT